MTFTSRFLYIFDQSGLLCGAAAAADRNTRCTIIGGGAERNRRTFALGLGQFTIYNLVAKGSFMSKSTKKNIPNLYPVQKI